MLRLPTVILRHTAACGTHYDWLLANPRRPAGRLWAARVTLAPRDWAARGRWMLTPIAPHRRIYLHYQGPLEPRAGRARGAVVRVDEGTFVARLWTDRRIVMRVRMRALSGDVELRRLAVDRWMAQCV